MYVLILCLVALSISTIAGFVDIRVHISCIIYWRNLKSERFWLWWWHWEKRSERPRISFSVYVLRKICQKWCCFRAKKHDRSHVLFLLDRVQTQFCIDDASTSTRFFSRYWWEDSLQRWRCWQYDAVKSELYTLFRRKTHGLCVSRKTPHQCCWLDRRDSWAFESQRACC